MNACPHTPGAGHGSLRRCYVNYFGSLLFLEQASYLILWKLLLSMLQGPSTRTVGRYAAAAAAAATTSLAALG
jgi:hypothetical protein